MFQSFTGSSRRPRQVNLSGRNPNPFANAAGTGTGKSTALANAQQDRVQRQIERDRLNAAQTLQRTWRGHACRRKVRAMYRKTWDSYEGVRDGHRTIEEISPYSSVEEANLHILMLVTFFSPRQAGDVERLLRLCGRIQLSNLEQIDHSRLVTMCLEALEYIHGQSDKPRRQIVLPEALASSAESAPQRTALNSQQYIHSQSDERRCQTIDLLLEALASSAESTPQRTALHFSQQYYRTMMNFTRYNAHLFPEDPEAVQNRMPLLLRVLAIPLRSIHSETLRAYEGFASYYLTDIHLSQLLSFGGANQGLKELSEHVNLHLLARAIVDMIQSIQGQGQGSSVEASSSDYQMRQPTNRLAMLAHFIYFHRAVHDFGHAERYSSNEDFVVVVSELLSSLADELDIESKTIRDSTNSDRPPVEFSEFIKTQLTSLVTQQSVSGMLLRTEAESHGLAQSLAGFALTLLRLFPQKGDEIRMWLYLGATNASSSTPAVKYFWEAVKHTECFQAIMIDPRAAFNLLRVSDGRPANASSLAWKAPRNSGGDLVKIEDEWRLVFVFMELYIFVLKVMDDDEFFGGIQAGSLDSVSRGSSRTRDNALPLRDVQDLTTFLKNLGFTLYFHAADLAEPTEIERFPGVNAFGRRSMNDTLGMSAAQSGAAPAKPTIATGASIEYVKGLVTGLIRMIYERDSRRAFLPKDHWLMTSPFDMDTFIPAVVSEEERRGRLGDDEEDEDPHADEEEEQLNLIGTGRAHQIRHLERLRKEQRKASRKRYLQAVAPRLEILQNMPFFIPFATRVQIFREFVRLDQLKRRDGLIDPDTWRVAMVHNSMDPERNELSKHHAKVRREHEFDDAYEQFYTLGSGLKEPIQITFVDQFDTPEAGIDGGGVTKEFLTSVTSQAFSPSGGLDLFVENDQHLLYPNPAAVDEKKYLLREAGIDPTSPEFRSELQDLYQRYEFLGRIVGKCLYEGILVDISFAGFFLLKWALTGGDGSAPNESGYRANLNDLKDLDEGLYQGLLKLKNYSGDVEDFGLNFTVTDTYNIGGGKTKAITRDLCHDGSQMTVTNANRLIYIQYMAHHRLSSQPAAQTRAFLRGLSTMIQPSWLSMFNQSELQTLIGGAASSIDVADLRRNTQYGGVYVIGDDGREHPSIVLFWRVMESLDDKDRRAVLKFVTSTPRAPLLGFVSLNPKFSIRDAGDDQVRLPSTSTCVNLLKLPRFKDEATMREKLLYAVNAGAGFDLS
ncbi:MAG: hypothetical protein M1820_000328 [Bogoriella megaspora]|nr:MAG: hypothetical protein M1820_000328 [Bogoriella megaspora]